MREREEVKTIGDIINPGDQKPSAWFAAQSEKRRQEIFKDLYKIARHLVKKNASGNFLEIDSEDNLGTKEDIERLLPTTEGEVRTISITVYDDEYNASQKDIAVKKQGNKYFLVEDKKESEIKIQESSINKVVSFESSLDALYEEHQRENNLDAAIERKNFALINRIIKNGSKISDEQVIKLMRLSKNETGKTPTFLHKLLDPVTGISDSPKVIPLLRRAKGLLSNFEYDQLLKLSDEVKPAKDLFKGKYKVLAPAVDAVDAVAAIDTHQESVHASVDISATKLYSRFLETHPDLKPDGGEDITETGVVKRKTTEFTEEMNRQVILLRNKIKTWQKMKDAELSEMLATAKIDKPIKELRFELDASKRLLNDCIDRGVVDHGYEVDYNANLTGGLSLKEALGLAYAALSDDEKLVFTGGETPKDADKIGHFATLVKHLKEIQREYNKSDLEPDHAKCPGGTMNHIIYALNTVATRDIVDIAYVTKEFLAKEAVQKTNTFLLKKLADSTAEAKGNLNIALAKYKFGAKLQDVLEPSLMSELRTEVGKQIDAEYGRYFRNKSFLAGVDDAVSSATASREIGSAVTATYKDVMTAEEFVSSMNKSRVPLYTKGEDGYEPTMEVLKKQDPEYYQEIIKKICGSENYQSLDNYQIPSADYKEQLKQIAAKAKDGGGALLRFATYSGLTEIASELIDTMKPEDIASKDQYDHTALHIALKKGHREIALKLVIAMKPKDISAKIYLGSTPLRVAVINGYTDIAKEIMAKLKPEKVMRDLQSINPASSRKHFREVIKQYLDTTEDGVTNLQKIINSGDEKLIIAALRYKAADPTIDPEETLATPELVKTIRDLIEAGHIKPEKLGVYEEEPGWLYDIKHYNKPEQLTIKQAVDLLHAHKKDALFSTQVAEVYANALKANPSLRHYPTKARTVTGGKGVV